MRVAVLAVLLLLSGCSHTAVGGASASVQTNSSALAAVLIMAVFISSAADGTLVPEPAVLPMDPNRKVVEQDCTRPVATSIPLKCR